MLEKKVWNFRRVELTGEEEEKLETGGKGGADPMIHDLMSVMIFKDKRS